MTAGRIALIACVAAFVAVAQPAAADAAQTGAPSTELQVWNLNTDRMATTGTDYRNFIGYITDSAHAAYYPDIVTIQEAGTDTDGLQTPSCHNFEAVLEQRTGGRDYYCVESGHRGGAAIVYRTGRLSRTGTSATIHLKQLNSSGDCPPSPNDWYSLAWRFNDDANAGKTVNVGAIHLPNKPTGYGDDCTWENVKLVSPAVTGLGGGASMSIMAGDWNHPDATPNSSGGFGYWECWFSGTNADLSNCGGTNFGWKDAMYRACGWPSATSAQEYSCLRASHWTRGSDRIDFLFAKAYAIYNQVTVPWSSAHYFSTLNYSDHRGQGAVLRYY